MILSKKVTLDSALSVVVNIRDYSCNHLDLTKMNCSQPGLGLHMQVFILISILQKNRAG